MGQGGSADDAKPVECYPNLCGCPHEAAAAENVVDPPPHAINPFVLDAKQSEEKGIATIATTAAEVGAKTPANSSSSRPRPPRTLGSITEEEPDSEDESKLNSARSNAARSNGSQVTFEGGDTFLVDIDLSASPGAKLGLVIDRANGQTMVVENITSGLLLEWNKLNPNKEMRPKDHVIEVNGFRGNAVEMVRMCREERHLELIVVRPTNKVPGGTR